MRIHHPLLLWTALACGCSGASSSAAVAERPPSADMKKLLAKCTSCHKPGPLDLSVYSRSELRKKLEAVRGGKTKHPTDMSSLSDEQLDEIAAHFAAKR